MIAASSSLGTTKDPTFRDALCLVAREGGRLVATVQDFDRAIKLDGQSVPMGGIECVFALEEYRRRGKSPR